MRNGVEIHFIFRYPIQEDQLRTHKSTNKKEPSLEEDKQELVGAAKENPNIWDSKAKGRNSYLKDCLIRVAERKKRTNVSFTMKRIDMDKLIEASEAADFSGKPVPTFTCRADVIYK
jgi:hypothetical protein